jgi:hypothetical protein
VYVCWIGIVVVASKSLQVGSDPQLARDTETSNGVRFSGVGSTQVTADWEVSPPEATVATP